MKTEAIETYHKNRKLRTVSNTAATAVTVGTLMLCPSHVRANDTFERITDKPAIIRVVTEQKENRNKESNNGILYPIIASFLASSGVLIITSANLIKRLNEERKENSRLNDLLWTKRMEIKRLNEENEILTHKLKRLNRKQESIEEKRKRVLDINT